MMMPKNMREAGVKVQKTDTEISRDDQDKINKFSRLNMKTHFLQNDIKVAKEELDKLEDAQGMVDELMGDQCFLFVGESFVAAEEDQAASYLDKMKEELTDGIENKSDELDSLRQEMKNLKTFLYARFGSAINLEEDE